MLVAQEGHAVEQEKIRGGELHCIELRSVASSQSLA